MASDVTQFIELDKTTARIRLHAGQLRPWDSDRRFIFIISGTQSGKTVFGPPWMYREIQRCGPGDYLAVTATYDLFKLKLLPELLRWFGGYLPGWGYHKTDRIIYSTDNETRIILRAASSEGGLESATAKAAWLDECGQDAFTLLAWEAVIRRLSISQGRILGTTTPYNWGWLKTEIYDRWTDGDPNYAVFQFESIMNPTFPVEEYRRAEATLPPWKFNMMYRGLFSRPAGMIYDIFDEKIHKIQPFPIPAFWPQYGGLDFGGVNTAAVCIAENPDNGTLYVINEYLEGGRTAKEHAQVLQSWKCRLWVGGSKSEEQWRNEFKAAGMPIMEPLISDVEVGISQVYGAHKKNELFVFNTLSRYLDEKGRYSRKLDASGQPTEEIANKNEYHMMDAERYIVGFLRAELAPLMEGQTQRSKFSDHDAAEGSRWRKF